MESLVFEFDVNCTVEHAFDVWTVDTSRWWPADHSFSGERGLTVQFEPRVGGRIFERTTKGEEYDWGEIVSWDPPKRLTYLWHLGSDRSDATEVEISFASSDVGTAVRIEHRGWERFGASAEERQANNRKGWGAVVPLFEAAAQR